MILKEPIFAHPRISKAIVHDAIQFLQQVFWNKEVTILKYGIFSILCFLIERSHQFVDLTEESDRRRHLAYTPAPQAREPPDVQRIEIKVFEERIPSHFKYRSRFSSGRKIML